MRDNVGGLGEEFIATVERTLKKKPAEYRRAVLGERGLPMKGVPVFGDLFDRDLHVRPVEFNPSLPLIETYDFGHRHPAVTWVQFPPGEIHILGGVMGSALLAVDSVGAGVNEKVLVVIEGRAAAEGGRR